MAEMHGLARWVVNHRTEARARRVLARLGTHLAVPADARLLELGSGGGGLLAQLVERYRPATAVGTDFDPRQVEVTRGFLTARWGSLPASVDLRVADAAAIPFPDGTFDVVFAMLVLHHVEDHHHDYVRRPLALREVRRVLKPGGRFVYSEIFGRVETRATVLELGFVEEFRRSTWRGDLGVYRAPTVG